MENNTAHTKKHISFRTGMFVFGIIVIVSGILVQQSISQYGYLMCTFGLLCMTTSLIMMMLHTSDQKDNEVKSLV